MLEDTKEKKNIIESIMKINKYQAIPSIPSQAQAFGYSESETKELEINKNPAIVHTGQRSNSVGPGQYE